MAEKIFDAQSNYGWGLSLNMTGKAPAIAKRIWNTYADALSYVNNFNDSAIEGLQLSIIADTDPKKNGVYFIEKIGTSKKVDGVDVANNDGILTKVGGADTETAKNYSAAVELSKTLVVGQLIKVSEQETVTTGEGESVVSNTYKAGFYIVEAPGVISALDTSTGAADEIGAIKTRVTELEANRVKVSDFNTYKTEISGALDSKALGSDLTTHTSNANIHVTVEDKAKWNNAEENAKGYAADEIAKLTNVYDAKGAAATAEGNAKTYTDEEIVKAKAYVDGKVDGKFDATGSAAQALTDAKAYTDEREVEIDKKWAAADATLKTNLEKYADDAEAAAIAAAKSETESQISTIATTLRGEMATDLQTAKDYADTAVETAVGAYTAEGVTASGLRKEIEDKVKAVSDAAKSYSIVKVTEGLSENVKEAFKLVDEDNVQAGETINIYKDSSLKSVELVGQELVFVYVLANGQDSEPVKVDVSAFLSESEYGNGLQVIDHIISVKKDASSEVFLSVSETGIKLSGVQSAIDTAKSGAESTAKGYTDEREVEIDKKWAAADAKLDTDLKKYADDAKTAAINQAKLDAAESLKSYYTKTEVDGIKSDLEAYADQAELDAIAAANAATAESLKNYYTKTEVDGVKSDLEAYTDQAELDAIAAANAYTDEVAGNYAGENVEASGLRKEIAEKDAAVDANAQGYANTAQEAAQGYAKTYTDLLFESFKFAGTDDIDALFATNA